MATFLLTLGLFGAYLLTIGVNIFTGVISSIEAITGESLDTGWQTQDGTPISPETFQWFGILSLIVVWFSLSCINRISVNLNLLLARYAFAAIVPALFAHFSWQRLFSCSGFPNFALSILLCVELAGKHHPLTPGPELFWLTFFAWGLSAVTAIVALVCGSVGLMGIIQAQAKRWERETENARDANEWFQNVFRIIVILYKSTFQGGVGIAFVVFALTSLLQAFLLQVPFNSMLWLNVNFNLFTALGFLAYKTTRALMASLPDILAKAVMISLALGSLYLGVVLA